MKKKEPTKIILNEEVYLRSLIQAGLNKTWRAQNEAQRHVEAQVIDNILLSIAKLESPQAHMRELISKEFLSQSLQDFSAIVSSSAFWEFRVKLLAARMDIQIGRKELNIDGSYKVLKFRDMSPIINDLKDSLPKLNLMCDEIRKLRNSIIHTNYQQLREDMNILFPELKPTHEGNVRVMNLTDFEVINLSDELNEIQIKEQDIFGWFLEATNSHLFSNLMAVIDESIYRVTTVIHLKAHSFDDRAHLFEKLAIRGEPLSEPEQALYIEYSDKLRLNAFNEKYFSDFGRLLIDVTN